MNITPSDSTPPDTQIDPPTPANPTNDNTPTFNFSGTDNVGGTGVASFECQIDGGGWSVCTSGQTFGPLGDGSHTFEVRAKDGANNVDPTPASLHLGDRHHGAGHADRPADAGEPDE